MSTASRVTLRAISAVGAIVLFSPAVEEEWKTHASRLALRWQAQMMSRKKIKTVRDKTSQLLRKKVRAILVEKSHVTALMKDIHLFELALEYDCRIVSMEGVAQRIARSIVDEYPPLGRVQWVNVLATEGAVAWISSAMADDDFGKLALMPHPGR